jgi:histidyl-tRNA synthetase
LPQEIPRGVKDLSPSEAISMNYIISVVEEVFKRFGFRPIFTPSFENLDILNAKAYGDESTKEIFSISGEEAGLRYDFTVPLARYVSMNKDLVLPFKRYQIGNIWRKEEPQHMRYREAVQADVDIVGSSDIDSDAEVIAANALAIEELGIREYTLFVNSRVLIYNVLDHFKVPKEKQTDALRTIDKMQKIGKEEVLSQLSKSGIKSEIGEELLNFIGQESSNDEKLETMSGEIEGAKEEVGKMQKLLALLGEYKINGNVKVDLSLVRGLNYYTGFIWEFVVEKDGKRLPTIAGGGRYDNLIGIYSKRSIPAVGSSLGISRIFDVISSENEIRTYAKVFIAYLNEQNRDYAINAANALRGNGIYVDLNSTSRSLSKQLEYAGSLRIKKVIILGNKERESNKVKLRDMDTGQEELISLQEAIEKLR